ncbi:class I SAM-dependent methyltransferase [Aquiflexum sp.]|uniref:class I SAM-dependent methyltransferase n=1 Tax=Aquiflexum sp. TaxID=1872584 RepID=UPI003593587D
MKDLFSNHSEEYARYRPNYPRTLFEFVIKLCKDKEIAWDCGTGNGQVADHLSNYFHKIEATDISENQLENAIARPNINYSKQRAEITNFPDHLFDLITVAQAIHWFDFEGFYKEVNRTAKKDAFILILGYGLLKTSSETDNVINKLYRNILDNYWEPERKYLDEEYRTIPFPFEEIRVPNFQNEQFWSFEQIWGYLQTWSAVRKYIQINQEDPLDLIKSELKKAWGKNSMKVEFPLLIRLGRIKK